MKRFFISTFCVVIFCIGAASLLEKVDARFNSDERALQLIKLARTAVGGDEKISGVRSMTIKGTTAHTVNTGETTDVKGGSFEINFDLPEKFSKMVRIGTSGDDKNAKTNTEVKVIVVKKGDGKILTEDIKAGDGERKIVVKKDDGTVITEDLKSDKDSGTWTTQDGKKILVDKNVKFFGDGKGGHQNEFIQTTLSLLLTAPKDAEINYIYGGEATVDQTVCNIVEAKMKDSSIKLYLDKSTNLVKMVSYPGAPLNRIFTTTKSADKTKDVVVTVNKTEPSEQVEHQIKFSDFRAVNGLLLPYKWTETIGGKISDEVSITNYEINPANINDKFKNPKILIETNK